jgi:hypothetical protein
MMNFTGEGSGLVVEQERKEKTAGGSRYTDADEASGCASSSLRSSMEAATHHVHKSSE